MNTNLMSELFGGADRYKALKSLYQSPNTNFGPRELASAAKIDPGNASRWLRRWAQAGLVEPVQVSKLTKYHASTNPALAPLLHLLQQDSEIVNALTEQLDVLGSQVEFAMIFGSTATGMTTSDSDIDLLLITDMSRLEAQTAFKAVARKLGKPVNVLAYTRAQWKAALAAQNPLVAEIATGARIQLKGNVDAIA